MLEKRLGKLTPVNLRNYWQGESSDFTPWLAQQENLGELSSVLGMELELEGTEMHVGPFKADIVARDLSSDSRVVIENQLDKTDHDHLGKILTYASGLNATVMIWIAQEFTEEHRRALDFLNEQSLPTLRCYGIVIKLLRIENSPPAPLFEIISSPNEYSSEIKSDSASGEISETKALYLDYWTGFRDYCMVNNSKLILRKPAARYWFNIAIGRSKFNLGLITSVQNRYISCEIYLRGANAKTSFRLVKQHQAEIEAELGALDWMELPKKQDCRIRLINKNFDVTNRNFWTSGFAWHKEQAEAFSRVFGPIIRNLPVIENAIEENDEELPDE